MLGSVRVLGVNPAGTRTDRIETMRCTHANIKFGDEDRWQEGLDRLPLGRLAEGARNRRPCRRTGVAARLLCQRRRD